MRLKFLIAGLMASSLVAAPAMANSASALSVAKASNVKAATSPKKSSKLSGAALGILLVGAGAITVVAATDVFDGNDDSDSN